MVPPSWVSWFINPAKDRYIYHKPYGTPPCSPLQVTIWHSQLNHRCLVQEEDCHGERQQALARFPDYKCLPYLQLATSGHLQWWGYNGIYIYIYIDVYIYICMHTYIYIYIIIYIYMYWPYEWDILGLLR